MTPPVLLHASCVSIADKGVLLLGDSGSGKSDLALRLIDDGAVLVGDDQVEITVYGNELFASAPEKLKGLLEINGIGIVSIAYKPLSALILAVRLVARNTIDRMPESCFFHCAGLELPLISLHAFDHSTPAKIRSALSIRCYDQQ